MLTVIVLGAVALAASCVLAGLIGAAIRRADERTATGLDLLNPPQVDHLPLSDAEVNARYEAIVAAERDLQQRDDREAQHYNTLPREEGPC